MIWIFLSRAANFANASVTSCGVDKGLFFSLLLEAGNGTERSLLILEAPARVCLLSARVELPDVDHGVLAARHKSSVILEPGDTLDRLLVCNKFELLGDNGRIELIDPDFLVIRAGKKMSTVRENNLSALTDRQ